MSLCVKENKGCKIANPGKKTHEKKIGVSGEKEKTESLLVCIQFTFPDNLYLLRCNK